MGRTYGSVTHLDPRPAIKANPDEDRWVDEPALPARWEIDAEPQITMRLKTIFPRVYRHRRGTVLVADTPEIAHELLWVMQRWPFDVDEVTLAHLTARNDQYLATRREVERILSGQGSLDFVVECTAEHRPYQHEAAQLALATGGLVCADVLGLGKTLVGLLVLAAEDRLPGVVVCYPHLLLQWQRMIERFLPSVRPHIIKTGKPYQPPPTDVYIVPYTTRLTGWVDELSKVTRTVVFDECQELRRSGSNKWMACAQLAHNADVALGLSATPVYNFGDEMHNIMSVISPGVLGSRDEFLREWCTTGGRVVDPTALGLYMRDQGVFLRRTRPEVGMPEHDPEEIIQDIDLDDDVLQAETVDAVAFAELLLSSEAKREEKWQAAGQLDWRLRQATGVAKAPVVAAFVDMLLAGDRDLSVVLWGWHREVYDIWAQRLAKYEPAWYTGSETPGRKDSEAQRFLDGDARLLMMSLRAGPGLDGLQERCHIGVFGELDWSPGVHEQCLGRLARDGQTEQVLGYYLIADGGSDPVVAETVGLKRQQSHGILNPGDQDTLFAPVADPADRMKKLAADFLARRGRRES